METKTATLDRRRPIIRPMAGELSPLKTVLSFIVISRLKLGSDQPVDAGEATGTPAEPGVLAPEPHVTPPDARVNKESAADGSTTPRAAWADDRLGYWPVHDRGGALSAYSGHGDRGMLGVLARIELNEADGKKLDNGLPANALRPKEH